MNKTSPSQSRIADFYIKHEYAFVFILILIWQLSSLAISDGRLVETDNYTHALRLMDFIQSGSWREILYLHDNCPFGQILHFTRLTDMFLFVTTLPFLPFFELKQAVLYGGFLYNPVMALLSAAALIWAGKAFCRSSFIRLTGVVIYFFITPETPYLFVAGRPDHHVLLNLLLILLSGFLLYGAKTQRIAYYKAAGLFGGLAIWASPEGLLASLSLLGGMVAAWFARCQSIRQIKLFSLSLFISTAVCWLVNPPLQGLLYPDNGRLSILMVFILGFIFLSFHIEETLEKEHLIPSFPKRFASLSVLAFASFGFTLILFDSISVFSPPIPPEIFAIWGRWVNELQPAAYPVVLPFVGMIFFATVAFVFAPFLFRKALLNNGIPLVFFTLSCFISIRFVRPASVYAVIIVPLSFQIIYDRFPFLCRRVTGFLLALLLISLAAFTLDRVYKMQKIWMAALYVPQNISPYLSEKKGCILAENGAGPETAWSTERGVIGSPYHSNAKGIIDNYIILNSTDMNIVKDLLKKHAVSTIILPNPDDILEAYFRENGISASQDTTFSFSKSTLPDKLFTQKKEICFLKKVTGLPEKIRKKIVIYHVDFTACEKKKKQNKKGK